MLAFKERKRKVVSGIIAGLFTLVALPTITSAGDLPGEGISVQPVGGAAVLNQFTHNITKTAFEKMGYTVKPYKSAEYTAIHLSIGQGDADYCLHHWNPLHEAFYQRAGGAETIVRFDAMVGGADQGYYIDKKTADKYNITNIEQFKDPKIAKLFDSDGDGKANLTGANPGWGAERVIEHHLDAYKLRDSINHDQGSYFALIADTITRYKNGESILYFTWTPMWVSSVLRPGVESVWLEVPFSSSPDSEKQVSTKLPNGEDHGFALNELDVIAYRGFIEKNPAIEKFFQLMKLDIDILNAEAMRIQNGEKSKEDVKRHADEWIKANQSTFDSWVEQSIKAAN